MQLQAEDLHMFMDMCFAGGAPVKISSKPGSGKSKGIKAYARRMNRKFADDGGYGMFVCDLSKANIADVQGYLMPYDMNDTDVSGIRQKTS